MFGKNTPTAVKYLFPHIVLIYDIQILLIFLFIKNDGHIFKHSYVLTDNIINFANQLQIRIFLKDDVGFSTYSKL